jgi:hypothetical protein
VGKSSSRGDNLLLAKAGEQVYFPRVNLAEPGPQLIWTVVVAAQTYRGRPELQWAVSPLCFVLQFGLAASATMTLTAIQPL